MPHSAFLQSSCSKAKMQDWKRKYFGDNSKNTIPDFITVSLICMRLSFGFMFFFMLFSSTFPNTFLLLNTFGTPFFRVFDCPEIHFRFFLFLKIINYKEIKFISFCFLHKFKFFKVEKNVTKLLTILFSY